MILILSPKILSEVKEEEGGLEGRGLLLYIRGRQILRKWEGVKENGEGFELGKGVRGRKRKKRRGKGEKVKRGRVR